MSVLQESTPANANETVGKLGCVGRLGVLVLVLIFFETALQLLFQYQRRCPPVSGVVVDRDTGEPIGGAFVTRQMLGMSRNPVYYLGGSSGPTPLLPFASQETDRQGRFAFPADKTVMKPADSGDPFIYLYGPDIRQALRIIVYSADYVPVRSKEEGFDWKKEEWLSLDQEHTSDMRNPKWKVIGPTGFSVIRSGDFGAGYHYRIEMVKAVTEAQWEEKCHDTWLLNSLYVSKDISDEWLFNDLAGYLERWPEGEKAGEYYALIWETAALGTCDYVREALARGELTRARLRTRCERGERILSLTNRLRRPPEGMTEDSFEKGLEEHERGIYCAKELLDAKEFSGHGGKS